MNSHVGVKALYLVDVLKESAMKPIVRILPGKGLLQLLFTFLLIHASSVGYSQARLVLNNNAWLRIDNGAWVVIENPTSTGIQTLGTGGNIRSEGEFDRVRWQIRNTVGTYVVPFTSAAGVKMPLSYTSAGGSSNEASASICFSTYNHASSGIPLANAWNNDLYRPSDVSHMNSYNAPTVANSQNAVDRFWIIDPGVPGFAYATRPSISLSFVYDASTVAGEVTTGNAIGPGDPVGAQRFNSGTGQWGDYLPSGIFNPGVPSSVTGATAGSADFFRSWTLANILSPLPVELLSFSANCRGSQVELSWVTGSENNSSHFVVERGTDGVNFDAIAEVAAAGFSQTAHSYSYVDQRADGQLYYRLRTVDLDDTYQFSPTIASSCGLSGGLAIVSAWDTGDMLNVSIKSPIEQDATVSVFDMGGKLLVRQAANLVNGEVVVMLSRSNISFGIYMIRVDAKSGSLYRRVNLFE